MVGVFHFGLIPGAEAGFLGVDISFVISGFLISSIIIPVIRYGSFRVGVFYVNRIRRLAPALVLTVLGGGVLLLPSGFEALSEEMLFTQFSVSNVYLWRTINYFGLLAEVVPLLHTWSLGLEAQFYLLYPVGLVVLARLRVQWLWPAIALVTLGSFVLNLAMVQGRPEASFYLLPTCGWELLAGALVFWAVGRAPRLNAARVEALAVVGLALIGVSLFAHQPDLSVPGAFEGPQARTALRRRGRRGLPCGDDRVVSRRTRVLLRSRRGCRGLDQRPLRIGAFALRRLRVRSDAGRASGLLRWNPFRALALAAVARGA